MRELNLEGWRCEVEPSLASPHPDARQLRLDGPAGKDYAVAVEFQDAGGGEAGDPARRIRRQLRAFAESL